MPCPCSSRFASPTQTHNISTDTLAPLIAAGMKQATNGRKITTLRMKAAVRLIQIALTKAVNQPLKNTKPNVRKKMKVPKMNTKAFALLAPFLLVACAVPKTPVALGGSRADGTVSMGYNVGAFEKPIVDHSQALAEAITRCKAWGYDAAEAFGGEKHQCNAFNGYGDCVNTTITNDYQCTKASERIK
jgi:hypothetical protein